MVGKKSSNGWKLLKTIFSNYGKCDDILCGVFGGRSHAWRDIGSMSCVLLVALTRAVLVPEAVDPPALLRFEISVR